MSDPVVLSLALGVAGNLATNITGKGLGALRDTPLGGMLMKAGILDEKASDMLKGCISRAVVKLMEENSSYSIAAVQEFFKDSEAISEISEVLIGNDEKAEFLAERLYRYVTIPTLLSPIDTCTTDYCNGLVMQFFLDLEDELASTAEPGLLWLSARIKPIVSKIEDIARSIDRLSDSMPALFEMAATNIRSKDHVNFENTYLEHIKAKFGKLTTPGARDLHGVNQALSIAYISLNIKTRDQLSARAEDLLISNRHLVLRGPAGSGKTTLLSWIVTRCADLSETNPWRNGVPFFIPLRTVARTESGAPSVTKFVTYSTDPLLWAMPEPEGWVNQILKVEKRGVIMIDGVDELPPGRRSGFWKWLKSFSEQYPGNRIVVTSRTLPGTVGNGEAKITDQWNPPTDFSDSSLQEMSDEDITQFIHHWHDAVEQDRLDSAEKISLADARINLPGKLVDPANRRIRELCSTPLLCAMVCVLHWREEGYLPRQRVDLYDKCCDMLIEARDLKRNISPPSGALSYLTKDDKAMMLQHLAFDMMNNKPDGDSDDTSARIEISREKALQWIAPKIVSFASNEARQASPEEVLNFLIERTGLLREPATSLVDFPHRTFQEYLAACAAGADSQEQFLAKLADDDQWHETIMLAAGTTTGGVAFGRRLIAALLNRAENHKSTARRSQRIRKTCLALALGCLENLRQQDPALRDRVLSHVVELVPPRGEADARILSVAGDAAVAFLGYDEWKDETFQTVHACAISLRLIGTVAALDSLKNGYIDDDRDGIAFEICKTGKVNFSQIAVVSKHVEKFGSLPEWAVPHDMVLLEGLGGLRHLTITAPTPKNLETIDRQSELVSVSLEGADLNAAAAISWPSSVESISIFTDVQAEEFPIKNLPALRDLIIYGSLSSDAIGNIALLTELNSLRVASFEDEDISKLRALEKLETFQISDFRNLNSVEFLKEIDSLINVTISDCASVDSFSAIDEISKLNKLTLSSLPDDKIVKLRLEKVSDLEIAGWQGNSIGLNFYSEHLNRLNLERAPNIISIPQLADIKKLYSLSIRAMPLVTGLPDVGGIEGLEELRFSGLSKLRKVHGSVPSSVRSAWVSGCDVRNVEFISSAIQLKDLRLISLPRLEELSILRNFPELETLTVANLRSVENLEELGALGNLKTLIVGDVGAKTNLEPLVALGSLEKITIITRGSDCDLSPLVALPKLQSVLLQGMGGGAFDIPDALKSKIEPDHGYMAEFGGPHWGPHGFRYRRFRGSRRF